MVRYTCLLLLLIFVACSGQRQEGEEAGQDQARIEELKSDITENPEDFRSYYQLGQVYSLQGDTARALTYLDSALALNPDYLEARFVKGELLFNSGQRKTAFQEFVQIMGQDSSNDWVKRIGSTVGLVYPIQQITDAPGNNANPCYDLSGERIVFQSNRNRKWDLFLLNCSGKETKQLTKNALNDESPVFATDNIIYFTRQQAANDRRRDIYVYDLKEQSEHPLIVHPADDWYPAPAPDGQSIFFVSDREIDNNQHSKIFRYGLQTQQIQPILYSELDYSSPWANPSGNEILFTVKLENSYSLFKAGFDGKKPKRLSTRDLHFGAPKYSPGGKTVVFFSKQNNNLDIFELDLQNENVTRLTNHPENDLNPSYSPDGSHILFYSNRSGRYQIYELDMNHPFSRNELLNQLQIVLTR